MPLVKYTEEDSGRTTYLSERREFLNVRQHKLKQERDVLPEKFISPDKIKQYSHEKELLDGEIGSIEKESLDALQECIDIAMKYKEGEKDGK